jgi:lysophospholipase
VHLLAQQIMENYALYDSFIVCVGVATLTYVASLLSFMFENLQKLVVVTGCLVPISFMRNDAFQNLLNSLTLAGHFMIPEVLVVFGHQAFRGNRTRTLESDSFDGIDSPNLPPLVKFGISIDIEWGSVMRRDPSTPTTLAPSFCTDIIIIKVTPFTTFEHIKHILNTPKLRCCIFECYHYGEMPHSEELLELLKSTQEKREIVVIMIPQCIKIVTEKAGLKESYKEGLIVRYDITPEAALAKMGYLLGKNYTLTQIRGLF